MTYDRHNPLEALITERERLTPIADEKETFHVVLDLGGKDLSFKVGDSVGIYGQNDPTLVDRWLVCLRASGNEEVFSQKQEKTYSLRQFLSSQANLVRLNASFAELLGFSSYEKTQEPLDLLEQAQGVKFDLQALSNTLSPLLPRFYSIASSQHHRAGTIDLTVAHLRYFHRGNERFGVASHFLCYLAKENESPIPLYVQPTTHFTLPEDHDRPIIMIGPGTGVAPFRGFLQERLAKEAKGKNWLFFGERSASSHFYYADFWKKAEELNQLRLTTAFSRDQSEKIYVQHRMKQHASALWDWIQEGAHIYICGDAEKMAKEVEACFLSIFETEGNLSPEKAKSLLFDLRKQKRYLTDVY